MTSGSTGFCVAHLGVEQPTVMMFGLPCEQRLPKIIAIAECSTPQQLKREYSRPSRPKTKGIITVLQMDSSCADLAVRVRYAQPGSPSPTRVLASGAVSPSLADCPSYIAPAALRTGNTLGLAPATVVSYRGLWRVRDRFCANYPLNYANNERSSSQPHSPVGRAVHAGRCGSHDRLGHRRRADRSPAASASARITEMMRACRHEGCAAQTSALQRASD